jgi:hypothetical protein
LAQALLHNLQSRVHNYVCISGRMVGCQLLLMFFQ